MSKKKAFLLGIDVGTSSTKALLCKPNGKVVAVTESANPISSPKPGWNEQAPKDWWKSTIKSTRKLLKKYANAEILGIGLSGQMHGSVFLDKDHKIIRPALLWNDQRTEAQCQKITASAGGIKALIRLVNNPALTGYTAPKVLWLRDNEPEHYAKLHTLLLPKDYIRFLLTGDLASEVSDASGTLLLDVKRRKWSKKLLEKLDLPSSVLPPLAESPEIVGTLTKAAAKKLGLKPGIPVVAGAGDQPAGAIGMGIVEAGMVSATIGTSGVVFAHSDSVVANPQGLLQSFCHAVPDKWCVFGCMLAAGASLEWMRTTLHHSKSFKSVTKKAMQAPSGSLGLFFLPYLDGERCPHPDPNSRACWVGLGREHNLSTMTRATFEGITYGMKDQLRLMMESQIPITEIRCAGGGAKSRFWLELQANIYGAKVTALETEHASAFGAALLSGVGAGIWKSIEEAGQESIRPKASILPNRKQQKFYHSQHETFRSLYPALKSSFHRMACIS